MINDNYFQEMKKLLIVMFVCNCWSAQAQLKPFYSTKFDKYGYINGNGQIVVLPKYDFAWEFKEGMSPMKLNGKYGYINDDGDEVVPPKYDHAWMFSDGLSVVKVGDKFGFIDKTGKLVVPAIYERADNFHDDRANVCLKRKWKVMIYPQKSKQP